jgi:hypothetical protein
MRVRIASLWLLFWICSGLCLQAGSSRILKVLPFFLDLEGRVALSPSLYERDAYQAYLRMHVEKRSALRFDVNWKVKGVRKDDLLIRVELKNSKGDISEPLVLQRPVRAARFFSSWSSLVLGGEEYADFGQLLAWRVTLWQGDQLLAEQRSFLW